MAFYYREYGKFPQLQFSVYSYSSGLFGLETSKYEIHEIFDTNFTQKHQKSNFLNMLTPVAFEMAFATFVGLFLFFLHSLMTIMASGTKDHKKILNEIWHYSSLW